MGSNKNILIGQGGGPTNVINQSLVGIIIIIILLLNLMYLNQRFLGLSMVSTALLTNDFIH